jgi:FAD:protein FMN transferase
MERNGGTRERAEAHAAGNLRHGFRAMGTDITLIAGAGNSPATFRRACRQVALIFDIEEKRFSRFRAESELSHVNSRAGGWIEVSSAFAKLTRFSLEAARETDGLFDPTVLPAMIAAGYDRDFDEVIAGARGALHPPRPCGRWRDVEIEDRSLRLPHGVGLDFGGVAKGWTVDLAAEAADSCGLTWAVVNAGGDLRIAGRPPAPGIEVGVEDPERPELEAMRLVVDAGALATSSILARVWGPDLHQLIDPRTGAPARTDALQATTWATSCARAEILAKLALLTGPKALDRCRGALVMGDGDIITNFDEARKTALA